MNWDNMPELRKMKNTSITDKDVLSLCESRVSSNMTNLIIFLLKYGFDGLINMIFDYINSMEDNSILGANRRLALVRKLNLIMQQHNITPYDFEFLDKQYFENQHFIDFDYDKLFSSFNDLLVKVATHKVSRFIDLTKKEI